MADMTRRRLFLVSALAGTGVTIAACGETVPPARPAATAAPAPAAPTAAVVAPTVPAPAPTRAPVRVLHWFGYAPPHRFGKAQQAVLDDFQTRNPGRVVLEVGEASATVALAKIKTTIAAGTPPSMWFGWQVEASDLFGLGAVADLNEELKANKDWGRIRGELIPTLLNGASWKSKLTLMPMMADPNVIGFNKKFLETVGVALPADGYTWEEFLQIGQRAAQPPDRVLGQFNYLWSALQWWGFTNGVVPLSADRTKVQFDSPGMLATLEWLHQQVGRGMLRNGPGDFDLGKTLTEVINPGTVTPPRYPNVDPGDGSGVHVTHYPIGPLNTKKELITAGNVFGFVVFKGNDRAQVEAAAEIAAWSVRPDVQLKVAQASTNAPANLVAAKDPAISRMFGDNTILKRLNHFAQFDYPTPNFPSWGAATMAIDGALGRVAKGELVPKDALAEIQSKVQALVDEDLKKG